MPQPVLSTTQAERNAMLQTEINFLKTMGIPISDKIEPDLQVNFRAKARLGCCIYRGGSFTIELSASLFDENLPQQKQKIRQTLLHELLHTCPQCGNHGQRWKEYARQVSEYTGLSITRTYPRTQEQTEKVCYRYILRCQNCGKEIGRMKMSSVVQHPERYRCKCGGRIVRSTETKKAEERQENS